MGPAMSTRKTTRQRPIAVIVGSIVILLSVYGTQQMPCWRHVALEFCKQRSGLVFVSYAAPSTGQLWRFDGKDRLDPLHTMIGTSAEQVTIAPDAKRMAYSLRDGSGKKQLFLACADGTQSFAVTAPSPELTFFWVNSQMIQYAVGSFIDDQHLADNDLHGYLLDVRFGSLTEIENPYQHEEFRRNPRDPDIAALFDRGGDYYLVGVRTGEQTKIMDMHGGYVTGEWSSDGQNLVFRALLPNSDGTGQGIEMYSVRADGTGLRQITSFADMAPGRYPAEFALSPDGKWIALLLVEKNSVGMSLRHLYLQSVNESRLVDLGISWRRPDRPVWSPDSHQIAFVATRVAPGQEDLFTISVDTGEVKQITNSNEYRDSVSWR